MSTTRRRREPRYRGISQKGFTIIVITLQIGLGVRLRDWPLRSADAASVAAQSSATTSSNLVLENNLLVHKTPYFENTSRVVPPSPACPNGKIVIATGQPRDTARLLDRPLFDSSGNVDVITPTSESEYPIGTTKAIATDNQIVRLKDGNLLALKDSHIWDDITFSRPPWSGETVTGTGEHKAQRAGETFFRSTDCGSSWTLYSTIDFATAFGGKYGVPRPRSDAGANDVPLSEQGHYPDGSLRWWVGGPDRTEIYACPFTGNIYLSTLIISGPYKTAFPKQLAVLLILYSKDGGKTWDIVTDSLPSSCPVGMPVEAPLLMTSTPNGRLFLFNVNGGQPRVYFSTEPLRPGMKPEISCGHLVNYIENGKPVIGGLPDPSSIDLSENPVNHPSISRLSTDTLSSKIRIAYGSLDSDGNEVARVINVDVRDTKGPPVVTSVRTIRADHPGHSVMYFTFIDPDYIDMPSGTSSNTSVLYWIEAPKVGERNKRFAIRYAVFGEDNTFSCSAYLSVRNGNPRTWSIRKNLGDYMTGGFFWKDNTLNYVAQWVEPEGIKANIVRLPLSYRPPHDDPDIICAAPPGGVPPSGDDMNPDEVLNPGQSISSVNGQFTLIFQFDGNLVLYRNRDSSPLWASGTDGRPAAVCIMQGDGNLVIYDPDGQAIWDSGTDGHPASHLVVQNDGNAVIYQPDGTAIWATDTVQVSILALGPPGHGDDLRPGEVLNPGQSISSVNGQFTFIFQFDGNLVLYRNKDASALWASGTDGRPAAICVMQLDGNLVIYDSAGKAIWASGADLHPASYLVIQDDGNAVVFQPDGARIWATDTAQSTALAIGLPAQGDNIQPGQVLNPGQSISSANGQFTLIFQFDSNLVLYRNRDNRPLWASGTDGRPATICIMQSDGDLVIRDSLGRVIWASETNGHPASYLVVQTDGNAVIFQPDGAPVWVRP